jgi:hypothetical protein
MREELHLIRLDQTFAANGQIGFWARLRADAAFAPGQSFASLIGVLPQWVGSFPGGGAGVFHAGTAHPGEL